jgi:hypothetical protein
MSDESTPPFARPSREGSPTERFGELSCREAWSEPAGALRVPSEILAEDPIAPGVPDALWTFVNDACRLRVDAMHRLAPDALPEPDRYLLVHRRDMTSTLAAFHGSALRVEVLQQRRLDDLYLREVFLRTIGAQRIVEYGVIAIALEQFTAPQREAIEAGQIPLGGLLHQFQIPFESSPISFFAVSTAGLNTAHRLALNGALSFGRFNRLGKPTGEPLAWIMEILPPPMA